MTRKLTLSRSRADALSSTHHGRPLTSKLDESIDDSCLKRLVADAHMRLAGIHPVGRFFIPNLVVFDGIYPYLSVILASLLVK